MAAEIIDLDECRPMTPLVTLQLYRKHDGTIWGSVCDAEAEWIETAGADVPSRFMAVVDMLPALKLALVEQAAEFADAAEPECVPLPPPA